VGGGKKKYREGKKGRKWILDPRVEQKEGRKTDKRSIGGLFAGGGVARDKKLMKGGGGKQGRTHSFGVGKRGRRVFRVIRRGAISGSWGGGRVTYLGKC